MLLGDVSDLLQTLPAEHRARRVVGVADQQRLGARGDRRLDLGAGDLEGVLEAGWDLHRLTAGEGYLGGVGHEARLRHDHLVARVEQGGHRQVQRLADAYRDQDFAVRVVVDTVKRLEIGADGPAQLSRAGIGGVARLAVLEAGDAGLQDHVRRDEIRLADAEADDVLHRRGDVEKLADPGRWHRFHSL